MTAWTRSPVRTSSPPITHGRSWRCDSRSRSRARISSRSGDPGAYSRTGSLTGGGGRKMPVADTARILSNLLRVRPRLVRYLAEGWGVGELWLEDDRLVWHELPRPRGEQPLDPHPLA